MWSRKRADCSPGLFRLQSVTARCRAASACVVSAPAIADWSHGHVVPATPGADCGCRAHGSARPGSGAAGGPSRGRAAALEWYGAPCPGSYAGRVGTGRASVVGSIQEHSAWTPEDTREWDTCGCICNSFYNFSYTTQTTSYSINGDRLLPGIVANRTLWFQIEWQTIPLPLSHLSLPAPSL